MERLCDEVVAAPFEAFDAGARGIERGEEEDADGGVVGIKGLAEVMAGAIGEDDIEDGEFGRALAGEAEGGADGVGGDDFVAAALEGVFDEGGVVLVVFDEQRKHVSPPGSWGLRAGGGVRGRRGWRRGVGGG